MEKIIKVRVANYQLPEDHPEYRSHVPYWPGVSDHSHSHIELTGRWKIIRHSPDEYSMKVEHLYTPGRYSYRLGCYISSEWEELGDGLEFRYVKRVWVDVDRVHVTEHYIEEEGEIQECCNGSH